VIGYSKIKTLISETETGTALLEPHRRLLTKALTEPLSRDSEEVIAWLHEKITRGTYRKEFFCGVEHLTQDAKGYLFWKDSFIGRLPGTGTKDDAENARKIAERCRQLEAKRFPITQRAWRTKAILEAPAGTCWKSALYAYALVLRKAERVVFGFWTKDGKRVVLAEKNADGNLSICTLNTPVEISIKIFAEEQGFSVEYVDGYDTFEALIHQSGITPTEVSTLVNN